MQNILEPAFICWFDNRAGSFLIFCRTTPSQLPLEMFVVLVFHKSTIVTIMICVPIVNRETKFISFDMY